MRHTEIIDRLELSLIETEYALADAQSRDCEFNGENPRQEALRKANTAIRLALLALNVSQARKIFSGFDPIH